MMVSRLKFSQMVLLLTTNFAWGNCTGLVASITSTTESTNIKKLQNVTHIAGHEYNLAYCHAVQRLNIFTLLLVNVTVFVRWL
jgi:hypothetical protein